MLNKIYIACLILSLVYIYAEEDLEVSSKITIMKALGELRENQRQQMITLSIVPSFKLNPHNITNLEFARDGKYYKPKTKCFKAEYILGETLVKCELDLSEISAGTYIISSFYYQKKIYHSKAKVEVLEQEKKVSDIKLINIEEIYSIYEYRKSQSIKLSFDNGVDIEKLNFIEIESDNKKKYKVSIKCYTYQDTIRCGSDIFVKGGKYKILYVSYGDTIIKTKNEDDLFLNVRDNIINLEQAYNLYGGGFTNSRHNIILFKFDDTCENDYGYFTEFSFTNVKTGKTYESHDFRRVYGSTGYSQSDQYIFDFHEFPPGDYYINYVYKRRRYNTKIKITIEPIRIVDLSKIYQDLYD